MRQVGDGVCRRSEVAPVALLGLVGAVASLGAGMALWRADVLPAAMAAHGAMMIAAWGCVLPFGVVVARYFKVTPRQCFPDVLDHPFWWNCHRACQYTGIALASAALVPMLRAMGLAGLTSWHGRCGALLMLMVWLQMASPLMRGSKGGPTQPAARPDDRSTWRGDHYDMTLRRRLFEGWHKPVGWGLVILAQVTILLGATLADAPDAVLVGIGVMEGALVLAILDSHLRGRWVDTHVALWGPPHNEKAPSRDGASM